MATELWGEKFILAGQHPVGRSDVVPLASEEWDRCTIVCQLFTAGGHVSMQIFKLFALQKQQRAQR